jgi:hypothetical protein
MKGYASANGGSNESERRGRDAPLRRIRVGDDKCVPFAWQEKAVLRMIRENCNDIASALGVYSALTIIASDKKSASFETTHQWLASMSGFSPATVKRRLRDLERLGLVEIHTPRLKQPSQFRLLSFKAAIAHGDLTLAHGEGGSVTNIRSNRRMEESSYLRKRTTR